jgi:3-methyladenine DNA glycosylase AlkD
MARYGIVAPKMFGVPMGQIQLLAKRLGRDQTLAEALWETGWYEARLLTAFVAEPQRLTARQMDRWCRDFDNWAVCDTLCFHLFDRTPHAFRKVEQWSHRREEFVRRAAFALLASLALHDKVSGDEPFTRCLPLIEAAAGDDRNFVKKAVNWALRGVGRRNARMRAASLKSARRLAASSDPTARWIGKDAMRELTKKR